MPQKCAEFHQNRAKVASVGLLTDGEIDRQIDRQTDRQTGANDFYRLSEAML